MRLTPFFLVATALILGGCSTKITEPDIDFKPPKYVQEMPSFENEDHANPGSLFGTGDSPLFSDRRAMQINDIVTVQIEETATSSSSGSKSFSKQQDASFGPATISYDGTSDRATRSIKKLNNAIGIGIDLSSGGDFSGSGSSSRSEAFATTISARIVKVLQNGNYFIEGSREILIDGEKQIIQLSGVIRPYDIEQGNTIRSSYRTEGDISRNTQQGWGTKILDVVWPF